MTPNPARPDSVPSPDASERLEDFVPDSTAQCGGGTNLRHPHGPRCLLRCLTRLEGAVSCTRARPLRSSCRALIFSAFYSHSSFACFSTNPRTRGGGGEEEPEAPGERAFGTHQAAACLVKAKQWVPTEREGGTFPLPPLFLEPPGPYSAPRTAGSAHSTSSPTALRVQGVTTACCPQPVQHLEDPKKCCFPLHLFVHTCSTALAAGITLNKPAKPAADSPWGAGAVQQPLF